MNRILLGMIGSLVLLGMLLYSLGSQSSRTNNNAVDAEDRDQPIKLYCAASNRAVVEEIRQDYEEETGRQVDIQYGASQVLLSSLEVGQEGDLYLPADDSYLEMGRKRDLFRESIPLAQMRIVIAVREGNRKNISTFEDLLKEEIRVVQAEPDAAAVGKVTREILQEAGQWEKLDAATVGYRTTVTDVANDLVVGAADAAIVYDAVLASYPQLEYIEIPELKSGVADIAVAVTSFTDRPQAALHFARYLAARDRGQKTYEEFGFRPKNGDVWADRPQVEIFAGSMLRPAIEETIADFEKREGVTIMTVYNGCGILVGQMQQQGSQPDAYFACDLEFMNQVRDRFTEAENISQNQLVIIVQEGNPKDIKTLRDLGTSGLRVGIGHEKQCAMGWLTQQTLTEGGVREEVMENVTVQTPTGDMLVNQLKAGSLDAAVVYLSNATGSEDVLDAILITGIDCAQAVQPIAVAKTTKYNQLTSRLLEKIRSAESKERFLAHGFQWQLSN